MEQANIRREFNNASHYHVLGATISITADSEDTDNEYVVLDMLVPPGFENGLHTHGPNEVFHVIDGEIRLHIDGEDEVLGAGSSGYVPAGVVHGFENRADDVSRVIAVMSPGGAEQFFEAVGEPSEDRSLPAPVEPTEEMLQGLFATGEEFGFSFLGPLPELTE